MLKIYMIALNVLGMDQREIKIFKREALVHW